MPTVCLSRIVSLFPAEDEPQAVEALSPVLGHLIDISLGMVLLERRVVVSPYSVSSHTWPLTVTWR